MTDQPDQPDLPAVEEHEAAEEAKRQAREAAIERRQVEIVFSLGGGELNDKPWTYTDVDGVEQSIPWHYDGVPSYTIGEEFGRDEEGSGRFSTIVCVGDPYSGADSRIPPGWRHVCFYSSSGEGDCYCNDEIEGDEHYNDDGLCMLCESENDGEHHSVYLGEGWGERVIEQPLYEKIFDDEDEDWTFLGSVEGHSDRIELFRVDAGHGDVIWVGRCGDEWYENICITEAELRREPKLREALPWIKEAESRAQDLADEKE
jgi:hypothetical protein